MKAKELLDRIQKEIHPSLKAIGFKKKGRTYNRRTDDKIIQVINFQSGKYPIGEYELSGIRESYYGKFTINLGIVLEDIFVLSSPCEIKSFYQEYDSQIRNRLSNIIYGKDYWWEITNNFEVGELQEYILKRGIKWLNQFENMESYFANWAIGKENVSQLNFGILRHKVNQVEGRKIINDYIVNIKPLHKSHKYYVLDLMKEIGIELDK